MFVSKDESLMAPWSPPQVDHRPSVFSQFRPVDVTLYDLLYEPMFKGQISIELGEVTSHNTKWKLLNAINDIDIIWLM
jgi:hypothetical protein